MARRPVKLERGHARPRTASAPADAAIEAHLDQLISPVGFHLGEQYRALGLRSRVLTLPVMLGVVLTMIWRHVASVSELLRLMAHDGLFHAPVREVSQQALSKRLQELPASLFAEVKHTPCCQHSMHAVSRGPVRCHPSSHRFSGTTHTSGQSMGRRWRRSSIGPGWCAGNGESAGRNDVCAP